jgi:hypothetical protein
MLRPSSMNVLLSLIKSEFSLHAPPQNRAEFLVNPVVGVSAYFPASMRGLTEQERYLTVPVPERSGQRDYPACLGEQW